MRRTPQRDSWPQKLGVCWLSTTALRRMSDQLSTLPGGQQEHTMIGNEKNLRLPEVRLFNLFYVFRLITFESYPGMNSESLLLW